MNDLKKEIAFLEDEVERFSSMEQAVKIVLNGGYGAQANHHFRWFDETIAEGITSTGQIVIKYITKKINEFLNEICGTEGIDRIVSSDTDSCIESTVLNTDIGDITIGDLYKLYTNESLELKTNKDSVRTLIQEIKSKSFDSKNVIFNRINYIMKHSVNKRMYEIKTGNDSVTVTEDHGVMIFRNDNMISIRPSDILNNDKLIYCHGISNEFLTDDFEIIDLGIQEIDVYDIEVEGTHNFFGNNILLHNSVYAEIEDVVKLRWPEISDTQQITDLIDDFAQNEMTPFINKCYEELAIYLNSNVNLMEMKREAIADVFIIRAKKNYLMRVYDNEGIRFADPYYKFMGVESVRTSHPQMVRNALEDCYKIMIEKSNVSELRDYVSKFKDEFMNSPCDKIGSPRGVTDVSKYSTFDHKPLQGLTIPIHVMASINYNYLVHTLKLGNKYEFIKNGSKIKFLPLKKPNPINSHVIGFVDELPEEFNINEYIDKESHFNKIFISPLESFMVYNGWLLESDSLTDLFESSGEKLDIASAEIAKKKMTKQKVVIETISLF